MNRVKFCILFVFVINYLSSAWSNTFNQMRFVDITNGIIDSGFKTIAIDPNNSDIIYVGGKEGIYKSNDRGNNWIKIFSTGFGEKQVNTIAIDYANSQLIFVGTSNGLYVLKDGGGHWIEQFFGANRDEREVLTVALGKVENNKIYVGTSKGLFVSLDRGRNWRKVAGLVENLRINFILIDSTDSKKIYLGTNKGLYQSLDGGNNFNNIYITVSPEGSNINSLSFGNDGDGSIYIGSNQGLLKNLKNESELKFNGVVNSIVTFIENKKFVIIGTTEGLYFSQDDGETWEKTNFGITSKMVNFITKSSLNSKEIWVATDERIYKSMDISSNIEFLRENYKNITENFSNEPSVLDVQRYAMRYAKVHPEIIDKWRRGAGKKAWLPKLALSAGIDQSETSGLSEGDTIYGSSSSDVIIVGPDDTTISDGKSEDVEYKISLTWELGELLFNKDQISISSEAEDIVELRDDILDEVNNLYFERRRTQIECHLYPTDDIYGRIKCELRIQELTAGLDALTGGWFSNRISSK